MNVNGIQSTSNPYAGNSTDRNAMGQQEFLQLLVAQMKNQDPINPMDGTEFASQLAQFNSVEQLIGVNSALTDLQQSQNIMSAFFVWRRIGIITLAGSHIMLGRNS